MSEKMKDELGEDLRYELRANGHYYYVGLNGVKYPCEDLDEVRVMQEMENKLRKDFGFSI